MPMRATNAHAFFVAMLAKMEIKWNHRFEKRAKMKTEAEWTWLKTKMETAFAEVQEKWKAGAKEVKELPPAKEADFDPTWQKPNETDPKPGSAVIIDDIILFAHTVTAILYYFICMVEILQHHRVTIKLRKTKFFPARANSSV